ncbi:MAG TPA: HEPN domain-containing protein, partial [Terrimicrobiaceae bacterium]|nr:HEPN domain-containing protein [Terrimicrobiaceae bacterium]
HSHQQRIEAALARSTALADDPELLADHAKYVCVLVSGFIEKSLSEIVLEHSRRVGAPSLERFVEANTARFTNANTEKVLQLLGSFDPDWRRTFEGILVDRYKDAFDSVVGLRHQIAHGVSVGVTYVRIKDYFQAIKEAIELIQQECIPDR